VVREITQDGIRMHYTRVWAYLFAELMTKTGCTVNFQHYVRWQLVLWKQETQTDFAQKAWPAMDAHVDHHCVTEVLHEDVSLNKQKLHQFTM